MTYSLQILYFFSYKISIWFIFFSFSLLSPYLGVLFDTYHGHIFPKVLKVIKIDVLNIFVGLFHHFSQICFYFSWFRGRMFLLFHMSYNFLLCFANLGCYAVVCLDLVLFLEL